MSKEKLAKLEDQLKNIIVDAYEPTITRWRRNHTARAEWFFLWNEQKKRDDQTHAFLISSPINPNSIFIKQFLLNDSPNRDNWLVSEEAKKRLFEDHYECKFTTKDQPPFD